MTEVAVDHDLVAGRGPVGLQPSESQLEDGVGLAQALGQGAELIDGVPSGQTRHGVGGHEMKPGQGLAALTGQTPAGLCVLGVAQDAAGDRLARHRLHDQEGRAQRRWLVGGGDDAGDGYPGRGRGPDHASLEAHAARGAGRPPRGVTAQHQRQHLAVAPTGLEGPRLPGRAARQSSEPAQHQAGVTEGPGQDGAQRLRQLLPGQRTRSRTAPTTAPLDSSGTVR